MAKEGVLERVLGAGAGAARMTAAMAGDLAGFVDPRGNGRGPDDPFDAWDPAYIRKTLPTLRMLADVYHRIGIDSFAFPAEDDVDETREETFSRTTEERRNDVLADVRGEGRRKWDGFFRDLDVIVERALDGAYGYKPESFDKLGGHRNLWLDIAAALNTVAQRERDLEAKRFEENLKIYMNYMTRFPEVREPRRKHRRCFGFLLVP
jgi:hypothetical protein